MVFEKVISAIKKHNMLSAGDHIIVGVSGGADSIALLSVLHRLQPRWNVTLTVAHLNHGLRGEEARKEAQFVIDLARSMDVACIAEERDVRRYKQETGMSLQEAARAVRYEFFLEVCNRLHAQKIALGHHADDQAETLLLWLLRGTSLKGLGGMLPVRDTMFIRPLITVSRKEIEAYLAEKQLRYIPDMSVHEQQYLRNKVRHHLLPIIQKEYNPDFVTSLSRLSDIIRQDNQVLEQMVMEIVQRLFTPQPAGGTGCSIVALKQYPESLRARIIKHAITYTTGTSRGIYFKHIQAIGNLIDGTGPAKRIQLPHGWTVLRNYDQLIFTRELYDFVSFCYEFDRIPERISIQEIKQDVCFKIETIHGSYQEVLNREKDVDFLDYDEIKLPLIVRNYLPGDRFYPFGLGGSKKLKDFFIEKKIPRKDRYKIPILLFQDRIAWVSGLRIDDHFRLKPGTEKVVKVWIV